MEQSHPLLIAAILNFTAAAIHVAIIFGGASWYRFFGAGEAMAQMAQSGSHRPTFITLGIASVLALWGLYGLSGAGIITPLPFLKIALVLITSIYCLRGIIGLIIPFISNHSAVAQNSVTFWIVSSTICCVFGVIHLIGILNL